MALKRMDAAEEALLEALQIAIRTEHWPLQIEVRCVCARLLAGRKLTHEAEDELDESLHLARHGGYRGAERSIELTRHATIKSDGIWSSLA
jgi:hypothetical protein